MLKKTITNEELEKRLYSSIINAMIIEFNSELKKKLTYNYLGIWTGALRKTTMALSDGRKVFVGTNMNYGYGYETGDWSKVNTISTKDFLRANGFTGKSYYQFKKQNPRTASWTGDSKHRPFMFDTIKSVEVQARISGRLKNANV
jgi:hypothetical protein